MKVLCAASVLSSETVAGRWVRVSAENNIQKPAFSSLTGVMILTPQQRKQQTPGALSRQPEDAQMVPQGAHSAPSS